MNNFSESIESAEQPSKPLRVVAIAAGTHGDVGPMFRTMSDLADMGIPGASFEFHTHSDLGTVVNRDRSENLDMYPDLCKIGPTVEYGRGMADIITEYPNELAQSIMPIIEELMNDDKSDIRLVLSAGVAAFAPVYALLGEKVNSNIILYDTLGLIPNPDADENAARTLVPDRTENHFINGALNWGLLQTAGRIFETIGKKAALKALPDYIKDDPGMVELINKWHVDPRRFRASIYPIKDGDYINDEIDLTQREFYTATPIDSINQGLRDDEWEFIAAGREKGRALVTVSFGSMNPHETPQETIQMVSDTVRNMPDVDVVYINTHGVDINYLRQQLDFPQNLLVTEGPADQPLLTALSQGTIIHGGTGSTAVAQYFDVPTFVFHNPGINEQKHNYARIVKNNRAGISNFNKLNPSTLQEAIYDLVEMGSQRPVLDYNEINEKLQWLKEKGGSMQSAAILKAVLMHDLGKSMDS